MNRDLSRWFLASAAFAALVLAAPGPQAKSQTETPATHPGSAMHSVKLYVFDGGTLHVADMSRFGLKNEEVSTTDLSVA